MTQQSRAKAPDNSVTITITATAGSVSGAASTNSCASASAQVIFVALGTVAPTANPQVALHPLPTLLLKIMPYAYPQGKGERPGGFALLPMTNVKVFL